jgi:hypothetical protein
LAKFEQKKLEKLVEFTLEKKFKKKTKIPYFFVQKIEKFHQKKKNTGVNYEPHVL